MKTEILRFLYASTIGLTGLAILILLAMKLTPGVEAALFREDGLIEDASAASYGLGAMFGFLAIRRGILWGRRWQERAVLLTVPLLALICALDEISWGARIFDLKMPAMEGGGEFDGLHDIFIVAQRLLATQAPEVRIAIFGVFALGFLILTLQQRASMRAYLSWFAEDAIRRCLGTAIMLLATAVMLDFLHGRVVSGLEEFCELSASIYMLLAAFGCYREAMRTASAVADARVAGMKTSLWHARRPRWP